MIKKSVLFFFCFAISLCTLEVAEANQETLLYSAPRSSSSLRIRIALHYKNIPFVIQDVDGELTSQESYKKLNPQQKVPTLLIDGHALSQTMAIAEYLEETRPSLPLLPKEPLARAKARQICLLVVTDIQPLQNLAVLDHLPKYKREEWARFWIEKGLKAIEEIVAEDSGPYTLGKQFTLADAFLYPQLRNARLFNVDLSPYPRLLQIEKTLAQHPAVIQALSNKYE